MVNSGKVIYDQTDFTPAVKWETIHVSVKYTEYYYLPPLQSNSLSKLCKIKFTYKFTVQKQYLLLYNFTTKQSGKLINDQINFKLVLKWETIHVSVIYTEHYGME